MAVQEQEELTNIKEVQAFLRQYNFYQSFILNYSKIIVPLLDFIKKNQNYEFGLIVKQAFQKLKEEFRVNYVLTAYNLE